MQKLTWKSTSLHKGSKDNFLLVFGKPGKQKTKEFSTENSTYSENVKEDWSISNALGGYSKKNPTKQSREQVQLIFVYQQFLLAPIIREK